MFTSYDSCIFCTCLVYFLNLLDLTACTAGVQGISDPSLDFTHHRIVKPILYHGRTEREIATTKDSNGGHHPEVTLTVSIDGEPYVLELRLNEALVPAGHVLSYQQSGQTKLHTPGKEELDICQYSGHVRGRTGSWAAVSTCHGVRGVIYDGHQMRYIEPAYHVQDNDINADHFVYSHEHLAKEHRCGYEGGATHNSSYDPLLFRQRQEEVARRRSRVSRYKRDAHTDTQVREPYNANKLSRYVELVLVVDHGEFRASGNDVRSVHRRMKDLTNIVNSVYAPLNIFIALVGVVIWTERDLITLHSGEKLLDKFIDYRKTELNKQIPNDNAHLITRKKLGGAVIGKGALGSMCSNAISASVINNHSPVVGLVAMTIAHELGHNLGMGHDTKECSCPDKQCIMYGSAGLPHKWSSCSRESLARAFKRGKDYCLRNIPKRLFDSPTCGNGFLEEGEQCDCGTAPGKHYTQDGVSACHACCRPDCTLRANATCGHGQCCDLTTCRPKAAGTECRAADRECDLPEYCTGHSQFCPHDVHKMDATPCGNGQAHCVRGSCCSHADQCRLLFGTTGENAISTCYSFNTEGKPISNCGYDRERQTYRKCLPQDVACGTLQCHSLNEKLQFGEASFTMFSRYIGTAVCITAEIDLGLSDVDPGLVPDGAKCGHEKMCLRQKCVPVQSVLAAQGAREGAVCPSNCSGHGLCNSEGNCHCEIGFAPPLCDLPGPGGSYDSGPASDTSVQRKFMVVMYIIFLGIVPSIFIIVLVYYYVHWNKLLHKLRSNNTPIKNNSNNSLYNSFENCIEASSYPKSKQKVVNIKKPVMNRKIKKEPVISTTSMTEQNRPKLEVIETNKNVKVHIKNGKISKEDIVIVENTQPVVSTMTEHNRPKLNAIRTNNNNVKVPVINRDINKVDIVTTQNTHSVSVTEHNKPKLNEIKNNFAEQKSIPIRHATPKPNLSVKPNIKSKSNIALLSENRPKPQVINTGLDYANELINHRAKLRKVTN